MDALLPALYFGQPIVGYRGRFDPERALRLIERYQIRNTFLFPTALKLMMKAFPRPRDAFDINLRSIMSAGEAVGTAVFEWARDALGVTINEMFGQTEMNYIVGNSQSLWPAKPGSMGRPYPGSSHRRHRRRRATSARAASRAKSRPSPRTGRRARSGVLPRVFRQSGRHAQQVQRRLVPHRRHRRRRRRRLPLVPGTRRRHVQGRRLSHRPVRNRELPRQASGRRERRGRAVAGRDARQRRQGVHRARARARAVGRARSRSSRSTCASISRRTSTRRKSNSSMRCR